jgi:hypothetical protein
VQQLLSEGAQGVLEKPLDVPNPDYSKPVGGSGIRLNLRLEQQNTFIAAGGLGGRDSLRSTDELLDPGTIKIRPCCNTAG